MIKTGLLENQFKKLQTFDSIYFCAKRNFEHDSTKTYLAFQLTQRYFKMVSNTDDHILSWKSKGLSDEIIKPPSSSSNILNPLY